MCSAYDVSCGAVKFVCFCLYLCVWLVVFEMRCLAAVIVSYCVVMCDVVWSVYFCFLLLEFSIVFECCL